jgi:hypothetical protein
VSTTPEWTFDRARLKESLDEWRATDPSTQHKSYVNEFLMDLLTEGPHEVGEPDAETGIFTGIAGNVVGSMIVIAYVVDFDRHRISVTGIRLVG